MLKRKLITIMIIAVLFLSGASAVSYASGGLENVPGKVAALVVRALDGMGFDELAAGIAEKFGIDLGGNLISLDKLADLGGVDLNSETTRQLLSPSAQSELRGLIEKINKIVSVDTLKELASGDISDIASMTGEQLSGLAAELNALPSSELLPGDSTEQLSEMITQANEIITSALPENDTVSNAGAEAEDSEE
jgi:hypothetical protein